MFLQFEFSVWYIDNLFHIYCDYIQIKLKYFKVFSSSIYQVWIIENSKKVCARQTT